MTGFLLSFISFSGCLAFVISFFKIKAMWWLVFITENWQFATVKFIAYGLYGKALNNDCSEILT